MFEQMGSAYKHGTMQRSVIVNQEMAAVEQPRRCAVHSFEDQSSKDVKQNRDSRAELLYHFF
jgi:hypothetical protein